MSLEQSLNDHSAALLELAAALRENTAAGIAVNEGRTAKLKETAKTLEPVEQDEPTEIEKPDPEADKKAKAAADKKAKAAAKKKAEAEKAAQAEAEAAAGARDDDLDEDDDAEPVTLTDVKKAAMSLRDNAGVDALEKAKKAFKIDKVKDIPEADFGAFVRHCQKLEADAEV